jgi:crotonobetainyl-CoA:carnitine CoA-transferase CaiB-like acyl-CoA transferase
MSDPQAQACGAFLDMAARGADGAIQKTLATPLDFGVTPVAPPKGPPTLGRDTDAVLREAGVDEHEIARLRGEKVIR